MNNEIGHIKQRKLGWGSLLAIVVVGAYLGFEALAISKVRYRIEAPYIHNLLVEARTANELCGSGDANPQRERFNRTLDRATQRYRNELSEQKPDLDDNAIERLIAKRIQNSQDTVQKNIAKLGCADRAVSDRIRQYSIYAKKSR